ncbi:tyrosine-type recombinase/integrase [Rhodococcus sp. YH1]|uniref:tyrosine-type recombinase/integrase n=1 Tax=Rhodococcus sp. YH1 TaxID=89066 RepID=UPI0013867C02|nr:Tyrosine recombinase XerC [Rhodococcus sp. YH1]
MSDDGKPKRQKRDAGTGGLSAVHRCGKKTPEGVFPCGQERPQDCPRVLWQGTLWLGYGLDGKRKTITVRAKNRNEAAKKLRSAREDYDKGVTATSKRTTVEAWVTHYMDEIAKPKLKPRTWQTNYSVVRRNIVPHLGSVRLSDLTAAHVRAMHKAIYADGKSTQTARHAHNLLSTALTAAVREGMIPRNVAELVDAPRVRRAERHALSVDQARALMLHSSRNGDPMATRWAAALLLGARQGELLGLTWDRVDLERGLMDISWQLQRLPRRHGCGVKNGSGVFPCGKTHAVSCPEVEIDADEGFEYRHLESSLCLTAPKSTTSVRVVPIPEPLLTGLRQKAAMDPPNEHNLVWTTWDGRPRRPDLDTDDWHAALKAAGLPVVKLHEARHTTASLLMAMGVEEHIRMQVMGHSSIAAQRMYAHIDHSQTAAALSQLGELLAGPAPVGA